MAIQIAVIGGGFTGAVAAIQLLHLVDRPFDLAIIEPDEHLGRGLAYGRAEPFHLLNVRAGKLGAIHGQPNDFAIWARDEAFGVQPRLNQSEPAWAFLPRRFFGTYVEQRLRCAISRRPDVRVAHLRSTAKCVRRSADGFEVLLDNGAAVPSHFVILATGTVLHHHIYEIRSAEDAAAALKPLAGKTSYILFSIGVIGTSFLIIPVLSGSISYILGEAFHWKTGFNK